MFVDFPLMIMPEDFSKFKSLSNRIYKGTTYLSAHVKQKKAPYVKRIINSTVLEFYLPSDTNKLK